MRMKCFGCYEVGTDGKFRFDFGDPTGPQNLQLIEYRSDAYEVGREYEIIAVDPATLGERLAGAYKAKAVEKLFETIEGPDEIVSYDADAAKHPPGSIILSDREHRNAPWFHPWRDKDADGSIGYVIVSGRQVRVHEGAEIQLLDGRVFRVCQAYGKYSPTGQRMRAEFEARDRDAVSEIDKKNFNPDVTPFCPQCGQPWQARACGPTHAILANEKAVKRKLPPPQPPEHCPG